MSSIPAFLNQSEQYLAEAALTVRLNERALGQLTENLGLAAIFICFSLTSLVAILGL